MSATSPAEYWALVVSLRPEAETAREAVGNFLWEAGAIGIVEEATTTSAGLRAFFPPTADAPDLASRLRRYLGELSALAVDAMPGEVAMERLLAEPWAEAWRAHFRPLVVGRRLCVCPPWERPSAGEAAGRLVVAVEPGRAFGTGGHPTTRGCLELLERVLDRGPAGRALDVGTGSGILAIAAARLGVGEVWAIDPDPDAAAAAVENAARNAVADRVRVEVATVEAWSGPPVPLVLANLLGSAHVALAPALIRCCQAGGRLIAGGVLVHEVPAVVGAFAAHGGWLVEVVEHEGWATLLMATGASD